MDKINKTRKTLSRLEKFLTKEIARLERLTGRKGGLKGAPGGIVENLSERGRVAAVDLDIVKTQIGNLRADTPASPATYSEAEASDLKKTPKTSRKAQLSADSKKAEDDETSNVALKAPSRRKLRAPKDKGADKP
jgi:hypothetical protein